MYEGESDINLGICLKDHLYVGDAECAQNAELLQKHGIKSVLALGVSFADYTQHNGVTYKFFHVDDSETEQLPWQAAYEWLHEAEKPVLVHSPAICIYYLMKTEHLMYDEALARMQEIRHVKLNAGFQRQLRVWELDQVVHRHGYLGALWWVAQRAVKKVYEWTCA